jgi:hypothetical protein
MAARERRSVSNEETLRKLFAAIRVDERFTVAVLTLRDGSTLEFHHRVGERWARAVGADGSDRGPARELLDAMRMFRLNAKHLDIEFEDGSRWEWKPAPS